MYTPPTNGLAGGHARSRTTPRTGSVVPLGMEARVAFVRVALRDDRLRMVAQPIVDLRTGEQVAEELLLRFIRRNGSVALPGPYVRAAECSRLALDVDAWVLERAAPLAASGRCVHVNLSGRTVAEPAFADHLETTLARHGANPSLITFEITETAPPLDMPAASSVAERIASLGAGLALDDFGTGYGSFALLHTLPVTMLKIDRGFVAEVATGERSRAAVASIVSVAERFGQTTVAEGVPDDAALAALKDAGVDYAQGSHIGMPQAL